MLYLKRNWGFNYRTSFLAYHFSAFVSQVSVETYLYNQCFYDPLFYASPTVWLSHRQHRCFQRKTKKDRFFFPLLLRLPMPLLIRPIILTCNPAVFFGPTSRKGLATWYKDGPNKLGNKNPFENMSKIHAWQTSWILGKWATKKNNNGFLGFPIESWWFNRDPYFMVYYSIPQITG